jgi:Icc protein
MKYLKSIMLFSIFIVFTNCEHFFEFSVYEANVKESNKNTTFKNLELLKRVNGSSQDFKFAFLSDVHYYYDELKTVIDDINKREDIIFIVFGGDIADQALLKEYEVFYDIMKTLKKPYLTVIGNHDYNANGGFIYKSMFGDYNYSFEFKNNKFVLFDDVVWESDKDIDFTWLSKELVDTEKFNQVFVIAHIPPSGDQFDAEMKQKYTSILQENGVSLSLHGHTHAYSYEQDDVSYFTVPSLKGLGYSIVTVQNKSFNVELIEL